MPQPKGHNGHSRRGLMELVLLDLVDAGEDDREFDRIGVALIAAGEKMRNRAAASATRHHRSHRRLSLVLDPEVAPWDRRTERRKADRRVARRQAAVLAEAA